MPSEHAEQEHACMPAVLPAQMRAAETLLNAVDSAVVQSVNTLTAKGAGMHQVLLQLMH
jgi:hypothetical protein